MSHELTYGLYSQNKIVQFGQLLAGLRGAKISVAFTNDRQRMLSVMLSRCAAKLRGQPVINHVLLLNEITRLKQQVHQLQLERYPDKSE